MSDLVWAKIFKLEELVEMLLKGQERQAKMNAELIKLIKEK